MYLNGDRQHNSYTLANNVINNLLSGEMNKEAVLKLLRKLLVFYFSFMSCDQLDNQIKLFEKYEADKIDVLSFISLMGKLE